MKLFKYKATFLLLLVLLCRLTSAQNLVWSDDVKEDDYNYLQIMGADEEGFFIIKSNMPLNNTKQSSFFRKREYHVIYFSNDLHQKWAKTVNGWNKDVHVERILFANFKPLVFFSQLNETTKRYTLYVQWLNNRGVLEDTATKIMDLVYDKKSDLENLEIYSSKDQTKLACVFGVKKGNKHNAIQALVINEGLTVQWSKEFILPFNNKEMEPVSFVLTNSGNLNMLANMTIAESDEKNSKKPHYSVFMFNPQSDSVPVVDILLEDKTPADIILTADNLNKKLILCGLFQGKAGYSSAGIFYATIDLTTNRLQKINATSFSEEFLQKFPGERKAGSGKELLNYSIDKVVLRNDGGAILTAEAFYTTNSSYYDMFTHTYVSRTNYNYNNVMLLSVNPDGNIDWGQVIPKTQYSTEDGGFYSSYCTLTYQDRIFYIYNDFSGRKNRVVMYTVYNKGGIVKKDLLTESNKSILVSKAAKQIDDNALLVPAEKNGKFQYLKIVF